MVDEKCDHDYVEESRETMAEVKFSDLLYGKYYKRIDKTSNPLKYCGVEKSQGGMEHHTFHDEKTDIKYWLSSWVMLI